MTPRFVSIEGGDGAGKSTQIRRLAATIERLGGRAVVTREPGGSPGAEAIRSLILNGEHDWSPRTEALLFAAGRSDHVERVIRPRLADGCWVLSDRFLDSSRAYQGAGLGLGDDAITALHAFGSQGLLPDRTLYLRMDPEEGRRRADARDGTQDRIGSRDQAFHSAVADAFAGFAEREPGRFRIVDANGTPDEVEAAVAEALLDYLHGGPEGEAARSA